MPSRVGGIDCNGLSPLQAPLRVSSICADVRGLFPGERFEDNGRYIGHDEAATRFLSHLGGSGNDVTWRERLSVDPARLPTVHRPGHDVTHMFELSQVPWFGMALCDNQSFPQRRCAPRSDRNAPTRTFPGGGSAFTELQFYPPGFAPIMDANSCDNTHWCVALLTFSVECSFERCNNNCIEPVNFAFVQTDGVPTGPPAPQRQNVATFTPNAHTLLMNPGDRIRVHEWDARLHGGDRALRVRIVDQTIGKSGFMTASARNGFMHTSIRDCSGTPFNFEPEYNTAAARNQVPWAALEGAIFNQFEIGHFTPCTAIRNPVTLTFLSFTDRAWQRCLGPYEASTEPDGNGNPETNDLPCYFRGDTHGGLAAPNLVTGCGPIVGPLTPSLDLDYDGTSYWPDWPNSLRPNRHPSPMLQEQPTTRGRSYRAFQFETTVAATESTCHPNGNGCAAPPPSAPGHFYPYYTLARVGGTCVWEFGQMHNGRTFGGAAEFGGPSARFFGTLEGRITPIRGC